MDGAKPFASALLVYSFDVTHPGLKARQPAGLTAGPDDISRDYHGDIVSKHGDVTIRYN